MRRWGLEVATVIVALAVGLLVLWAMGVEPDELLEFDESAPDETLLEPLPGVAAAVQPVPTTTLPLQSFPEVPSTSLPVDPEATRLCVERTKTFAYLGDVEALNFWQFVGESDEQLELACQQLAGEDWHAKDVWRWELATLEATLASSVPPSTPP